MWLIMAAEISEAETTIKMWVKLAVSSVYVSYYKVCVPVWQLFYIETSTGITHINQHVCG
jgi:hypothetical protein